LRAIKIKKINRGVAINQKGIIFARSIRVGGDTPFRCIGLSVFEIMAR
jgi:hypothetical protein